MRCGTRLMGRWRRLVVYAGLLWLGIAIGFYAWERWGCR